MMRKCISPMGFMADPFRIDLYNVTNYAGNYVSSGSWFATAEDWKFPPPL